MKIKLFSHKLQEGGSVMNHVSVFKELVSDLASMEVKYADEDLALLLLVSCHLLLQICVKPYVWPVIL